jgi:hypothetical protein
VAATNNGAPHADSHRQRSCRPCIPAAQAAREPGRPGNFGSSFRQPTDLGLERLEHARLRRPLVARRPVATQRPRIVFPESPVVLASSLIDLPPTKCRRRSSAPCSLQPPLPPPAADHDEARHPLGRVRRPPKGGPVLARRGGSVLTPRAVSKAGAGLPRSRIVPALKTLARQHVGLVWSRRRAETNRPIRDVVLAASDDEEPTSVAERRPAGRPIRRCHAQLLI